MVSYSQNSVREPRGKSVRLTSRINVQTWRTLTWKTAAVVQKRRTLGTTAVREGRQPQQTVSKLSTIGMQQSPAKAVPGLSNWPFQEQAKVNEASSAAIASTAINPRSESVRETRVEEVVYSLHVQLWFMVLSPNPFFIHFHRLALGVTTRRWLKCRPQLLLCWLSGL